MKEIEDCFQIGVKGLICDNSGNCLLLRRANNGNWDLPGGRMQIGESPEETLKRELEEEIGCAFDGEHLVMALSAIRFQSKNGEVGLIYSVYLCEVPSSFVPQLSEEHSEYGWYSCEEAARLLAVFPEAILKFLRGEVSCL